MELNNDEEIARWPFPTLPPTYGRYPSLSPWSFQRPYQQSPSGLLYPMTFPLLWESSNVPLSNWSIQIPAWQWTAATTGTSFHPMFKAPVPPQLPQGKREQPVVGYRAWRLDTIQHLGRVPVPVLHSTGVDYHWTAGTNTAQCLGGSYMEAHPVPSPLCECGFWVFSTLDGLEHYIEHIQYNVVGAVLGWGTVIQHGETGWRAQCARPIALLDLKAGRKAARDTHHIAKQYGLPVFEREALELVVTEHDGRLPQAAP